MGLSTEAHEGKEDDDMLIDCHVHAVGTETADGILRAMDYAGLDKMCLFSPYAIADIDSAGVFHATEEGMHGALEWLGEIVS